jgi:hypothetical protein
MSPDKEHAMRTTVFVTALVLALVGASTAGAADFTFLVPVAFHKIPAAITSFGVNVVVYDATWDQAHPAVGNHRVGYGISGGTFQNGEYVGTVTVSFNALYELRKRPEEAVTYEVYFTMQGPAGYSGGCLVAMDPNGQYPYDPAQPLVCNYIGSINAPRQVPVLVPLHDRLDKIH